MGSIGVFQLLILLIVWLFPLFCFWKILPKAGYSSWLTLLCIIPFGMFILLGLVAFTDWPAKQPSSEVFV